MEIQAFGFLVLLLINPSHGLGQCKQAALCCTGRDSSCVVQKAVANTIIEDLRDQPCYCDHACLKLNDCCPDYRQTCGGKLRQLTCAYPLEPSSIFMNNLRLCKRLIIVKPKKQFRKCFLCAAKQTGRSHRVDNASGIYCMEQEIH